MDVCFGNVEPVMKKLVTITPAMYIILRLSLSILFLLCLGLGIVAHASQ